MIHTKKGFTLFELMIVIALIGGFFVMTSYMTQDVRIYQNKAERLANGIYDTIRTARNNMIIGRWVFSWATMVVTTQRAITITNTGIITSYTYNTTSTGTEVSLVVPFFDNDLKYAITEIAVSSGGISAGVVPSWDQTGATSVTITISPNSDIAISVSPVPSPAVTIRTLKVTAGYAGFEQSVIIDRVTGTVETRKSSQD